MITGRQLRHNFLTALAGILLLLAASIEATAQQHAAKARRPATNFTPQMAQQIIATAQAEGLDPFLVLEVMRRESAFNPRARSGKGAGGLMQMIPSTAQRFGITNPYDPQQAITGGCRYLRYLMGLFPGRLDLVLAAYNAGENAVAKYNNTVPPYRETRAYVASITYGYQRAKWIEQYALNSQSARRPMTNQEIRQRLASLDPPALGHTPTRETQR